MIQFSNVSKTYGERTLFEDITFSLGRGERLGLVGRNGCGKSTIFRLILEEEHPDEGSIVIPRNYRCGHLRQHLEFHEENIVKEACLGLAEEERDQEYRAEILLSGLGFSETDMLLPASHFSGGFQIRVELARVLLSEPNLLLLDEPTNYLDIVSARWLTRFLREWKNEMILISHDRDFLDAVTTHTMLIHRAGIRKIPGGTKKLYEQVEVDEEVYEKTRVNEEKKRKEVEVFINRFRAKASKAASVQSRIKMLERMGEKEELTEEETLDFSFTETPQFYGRFLIEARDLSFAYEPVKNSTPLIRQLSFSVAPGERLGVIGKNGKGKSTLLKLLAGELTPTGGAVTLNQNTSFGYFGQTNISRLNPRNTIEEEISEVNPNLHRTRVRNICGTMMFSGDEGEKRISVLSGGEKSRVLLGKILAQPTNLLFLDEPTNHLDMESIEALIESVKNYKGGVVIVTHSEEILRELATRLIVFQGDAPTLVDGNYDYFLSKTGWTDEVIDTGRGEGMSRSGVLKELGKKTGKARTLATVQRDIEVTEKRIYDLEAQLNKLNEDLVAGSGSMSPDALTEITDAMAVCQEKIDEQFSRLEVLSDEQSALKKQN